MAYRNIVTKEDALLYKTSRPVTEFNERLHQLLDDMKDTLEKSNGVGLAAPQVGVLRRAVLVLETNVDEEAGEEEYVIELINPEIIAVSEEKLEEPEGCLSVPGEFGLVERPVAVMVRAQDRYGKWFEVEGIGLTARCMCHEIDHLEGILFTSKATKMLEKDQIEG